MSDRVKVPIDTAELVLARKLIYDNVNPSIEIDSSGDIVPRGPDNNRNNRDGYTVMVRKSTNSGDRPGNAKKLSACKGLKGCQFAECAKEVFGKLPRNLKHLEGLCPTYLE